MPELFEPQVARSALDQHESLANQFPFSLAPQINHRSVFPSFFFDALVAGSDNSWPGLVGRGGGSGGSTPINTRMMIKGKNR
jgi:hypothetical protein